MGGEQMFGSGVRTNKAHDVDADGGKAPLALSPLSNPKVGLFH